MLQFKSAQFSSQPDFTNGEVRRILKYVGDAQFDCKTKLEKIGQVFAFMDELKISNPNVSIQELQSNQQLWTLFQEVLGDDNWSLSPSGGI